MRMPVADPRSKILISRPHVCEAHPSSLGKFSLRIGGLHTFGDLVWTFTLHSEFRPQFVIRQHFPDGLGIKTDRRTHGRIVDEISEWRRRIRRGREPAHHHANGAVISFL